MQPSTASLLPTFRVTAAQRSALNGHPPCSIWLTGLSGSGKSTLAGALEQHLLGRNVHSVILDGDVVRHGLNSDLGFTESDRVENIRRVAEVGKLMLDSGLVVINAFISPLRNDREVARSIAHPHTFVEVFVDAPLDVAEQRDPKGLYRRARAGELRNFTGIDAPYEPPLQPDVHVPTDQLDVAGGLELVLSALAGKGVLQHGSHA